MSGIISLKKNIDFKRIYKRGRTAVTPTLVVYALKNKRANRLGITAGKKVGCAAKRNRAKRRIRALYREELLNGDLLPEGCHADLVVVARSSAPDADFERLRRDFRSAVKRAVKQINFNNQT